MKNKLKYSLSIVVSLSLCTESNRAMQPMQDLPIIKARNIPCYTDGGVLTIKKDTFFSIARRFDLEQKNDHEKIYRHSEWCISNLARQTENLELYSEEEYCHDQQKNAYYKIWVFKALTKCALTLYLEKKTCNIQNEKSYKEVISIVIN